MLGTGLYYDVEAFASETPPETIVAWLSEREPTGARAIVRIDFAWGMSVGKNDADRALYGTRLVAIAKAIANAGLVSHHYVIGNETNLPGEGGATPEEAAAAFVAARGAIDGAGPWAIEPVLMPSPPSTAAEYGGGDGSYLKAELSAIKAQGITPAAIALHAYENADGGGSANLFVGTLNVEATAVDEVGLGGIPLFVTEFNMGMDGPTGDADGAKFIANALSRVDAWNHGGEGNSHPGKLAVVSICHFVWHDDGNWGPMAIKKYPTALEAFKSGWTAYGSGASM
jgi:hypothetical protein